MTARNAASAADRDASSAEASAAGAEFSAGYARDSAREAHNAATRARSSAEKAGKDAKETKKAASDAWRDVEEMRSAEAAEAADDAKRLREERAKEKEKKKGIPCAPGPGVGWCLQLDGAYLIEMDADQAKQQLRMAGDIFIGYSDLEECIKDPTVTRCAAFAVAVTPVGKVKKAGKAIEGVEALAKTTRVGKLATVSETAFKASKDLSKMTVKDKHLFSAEGRWAKFDTTSKDQVKDWIVEGLTSKDAVFKPNNPEDTFKVEVNLGRSIGTKGQKGIRIIVTGDGRVFNTLPFNP
ncbi:hypothetical protein [Streptomyces sp. NPDC048644]|uniref:hypothetical protein n=1 Tax=Streptomyces sp. NPDC048644 TaxID=3365582 RepID=UPI00371DAF32